MTTATETENKTLTCPGCGGALAEVYAEANYGRVLLLDQCRGCGGVWFDRWELYFLRESSARTLEAVDVRSLLSENPPKAGGNACPKCSTALLPFIDPGLPKDATIRRCQGCGGVWLNRGDLGRYAAHKAALTGRPASGTDGKEVEVLRRLQKELKTADIARPTSLELSPGLDDRPIEPKEFAMDVGFLILQSLMRLVFKV